jgi:hypothetical protein
VAAVQFAGGAVDSEIEANHAAGAEDDLVAAAGMLGTVAEEPDVGGEQFLVFDEDFANVRGAHFFLAVE